MKPFTPPISFSNRQLTLIMRAAELIPLSQRDGYLRSVAGRLVDLPYTPSNADVEAAVTFVLNTRGIAVGADLFRAA
jgi:hypothetical protein